MLASWNDFPIEIRIMIIKEMDFISRVRLGACAKLEQQLVRNTPCKIEQIEIEKPHIVLKQGANEIGINLEENRYCTHFWEQHFISHNLLTQNWTDVVLGIFNTIGSKCVVGKLVLKIDEDFEDKIEWFRENVNFEPMTVEIVPIGFSTFDGYLEWPKRVKIICNLNRFDGPYLEKLNGYENIVKFVLYPGFTNESMTNEKLMKLQNATSIFVGNCELTEIGVARWVKQWLVRTDFNRIQACALLHRDIDPNWFETEAELEGFITKFEHKRDGVRITLENKSTGKVGYLQLRHSALCFDAWTF